MALNDDGGQAEAWKRKYYDALEQQEGKERQWDQAEDLLRKTISRLTLAADGLDETLDRHLKILRDAIRDRADSRVLHQRIEAMSESLVRLDAKRTAKSTVPGPLSSLQFLLDKLDLPRGHARRVKALRKKLESGQDSELSAAVAEFAALIHEVLSERAANDTPKVSSGGLLDRLFGRGRSASVAESAGADKSAALPQAATPDADLGSARDFMLHVLDKFQRYAPERVGELRNQALRAASEVELKRLASHLAEGFQIELPASGSTNESANESVGGSATESGGELLLQLLERLDLPVELDAQVDALKDCLEKPDFDAQAVLRDLATLIAEMRARLQAEKLEIEAFLKQLTARLQDIDTSVRGTEAARIEVYQSGRELNDVVQEQVRGIEDSVRAAESLDHLKQAVQQRIDAIITHVDQHRRGEEQRHQEVEAQVVQLTERLHEMESESAQLHVRIEQERNQALTDALTGIPNRLAYQERAIQELARWKRFNTPLALLIWDVDKFKSINDEYGHKAGDKVLKVIAATLAENIRETDFLARYGGEEFVLLMTGATQTAILDVAEKLRQAVAVTGFHFRGEDVPVTISCGITEFRTGDSVEAVFERADRALYRAKDEGRNRCVVAEG